MIRILVVDDSVAIRGILRKMIDAHAAMTVIGTAINGVKAVEEYQRLRPDIVLMDVEMPEMNGLQALEKILQIDARARVIMCSSLTQENAAITLKALELGAVDYIGKPSSASMFTSPEEFNRVLVDKITSICAAVIDKNDALKKITGKSLLSGAFSLRPAPPLFHKADVLAIGSSTGGLQALFDVLAPLKGHLTIPVVITQHMPASFTQMLGAHITQKTGLPATEAQDGMVLKGGMVYVAPGGRHLEIVQSGNAYAVHLSDAPPENFCRPAVDPMFRSLLRSYQRNILAVILTGMGSDGLEGARLLVEQSSANMLIAQDEASSVVWGMPGAVAKAGLCHAVLPIGKIGEYILRYIR